MFLSARFPRVGNAVLVFVLTLLATLFVPIVTQAQESQKIVRVGWFESPFNAQDEHGRRSGYSYDYQQKIAAYTGWTYEYVEDSWPELLQMLQDGRIDLLSDVSYTDERAEQILYSSLPMGSEEYYLYASPGNEEVSSEDYATLNGKKVGANKGSVQIGMFREWMKTNGVDAEVVELTGREEDNLAALARGDIDLYLSLDGFFDAKVAIPVCRVGVSEFFFAVSKSNPELLGELNNAMNRVQDENQYYDEQLYERYLHASSVNHFLNAKEKTWVAEHGTIRVGYQDDYMAFCAEDSTTGELTGALKDCLDVAAENVENARLEFEPVSYPTAAAVLQGLKDGEVDCAFPVNFTDYDGEVNGVFITPPLTHTDMSAIIRETDQHSFGGKERVTVAVNADNPNYDMFLLDNFPDWRPIYFKDTDDCLEAVGSGRADCLLISNYRYNSISKLCKKYGLTTWSIGVEMDFCLAVNRGDTVLYSVLSKAVSTMPASTVNAALTHYYSEEADVSAIDAMGQAVPIAAAVVVVVMALVILAMLLRGAWSDKKDEGRMRVPDKEDFALFDDIPLSYSVYHVTHTEHSELYDAEIVYVNHAFARTGGLSAEAIVGHHVRELFPHIDEEWYWDAKRAAIDGETVERQYADTLRGKDFRLTIRQVFGPGYCAITYEDA